MSEKYLNKVVVFDQKTGCIPKDASCYCYALEGSHYAWVCFKNPIFGRNDLKIHIEVLEKHGRVINY